MNMDDMILISIDDHIIEPPNMFDQHTPEKYKGRFPKSARAKDGAFVWVVEEEGIQIGGGGLNAVAGRRPEEYGFDPDNYDDMRKGCWDVDARIDDQNVNGILATLNFPTWPTFAGARFLEWKDKDLAAATIRAYNDWHIDEWCAKYPARYIPCAMVPFWDIAATAAEVKRVAAKGCHAITFPPMPSRMGLPSVHSDEWDPVWKACSDLGVVICTHIGDATSAMTSGDAPVDVFITNMPVTLYTTAADLVFSPVLRKFKDIHFALTEGGAGWAPHFLERIDYVYGHHHAWTQQDFGDKLPSDVFREHISLCFIDDETAIEMRHRIGIDLLTYETDYPHSDCLWPNSPEVLWKSVKGIPDADINKITYENSMRIYSFDPFKHMKKEDCTVGALRAQAAHVSTDYLEVAEVPQPLKPGELVTQEYYTTMNKIEAVEKPGA